MTETSNHVLARHPSVQGAWLHERQVTLALSPGTDATDFSLKVGAFTSAFRPVDTAPPQINAARHVRFDVAAFAETVRPAEEGLGREVLGAWVNEFHDWCMSGADTLQLLVSQGGAPLELTTDLAVFLDARSAETAPRFEALIAIHRAEAALRITFVNVDTGAETQETLAFDTACIGGQVPEVYQSVSIAAPEIGGRWRISFDLLYERQVDDGTGISPFLFVVDPRVSLGDAEEAAVSALSLADGPSEDAEFVSAPLPLTPNLEDPVELVEGDQKSFLTKPPKISVALVEDKGHTLVLSSDKVLPVSFHINGAAKSRAILRPGQTILRLPIDALTGAPQTVLLTDATGSFPVFQTSVVAPAVTTDIQTLQRETPPPTPAHASAMTAYRYASLRAHLAMGDRSPPESLANALAICEAGHETPLTLPLAFPEVDAPVVSVIIPAHNKFEVTLVALASLILAPNRTPFEVILVDDASSDETARIEEVVSGLKVIRHETPQRFMRACTAGIAAARGAYFVLLNNDVEVTAHWVDALVDGFTRFDQVGMTGAKLIYPNGKLQDGGGLVWRNGNPWNYGNSANPLEPRFSYARQADYLTGATVMISREVWEAVGGFSPEFEPMYFEDTDLAFKVRAAGYSTWYIPSAEVFHYEGMTSGTDVTQGMKATQETNRPKFKEKWAEAFTHFGQEGENPDLEKDRGIVGRVLVVDYSTPRPDRDAGSYAALQEMRMLRALGYKVTFLPMNMAHLGRYTQDMQRDGIEVVYGPFVLSPGEFIGQRGNEFDAVYATRHYVAKEVFSQIARLNPRAKRIYNVADLHFLREIRTARAQNDPKLLEKARKTRSEELAAMGQADLVLTYSDTERAVIEAVTEGSVPVATCPWVVDRPERSVPPRDGRRGLSFLGSFLHHPNPEALDWFVSNVMPKLGQDLPLHVYGAAMPEAWKLRATDQLHMTGYVREIADAFDPHLAFLAPLQSGAGIKGKVISAMAHGIPCIISDVAAEGMPLRDGKDCLIADSPQSWAEAIERLMTSESLWSELSASGLDFIEQHYSFASGKEKMRAALRTVDLIPPRS